MNYYSDNLDAKQKRYIDSLKFAQQEKNHGNSNFSNKDYYKPSKNNQDRDYERSADLIRMLNQESSGNNHQNIDHLSAKNSEKQEQEDPVKTLRKQMLLMDSLEKSRDPKFQEQYKAQEQLKKNTVNPNMRPQDNPVDTSGLELSNQSVDAII